MSEMTIIEKLRSQIGDDVQYIFDHEALFRLAADRIEDLGAKLHRSTTSIVRWRENSIATWSAMRAMRNDINDCVPLPSMESDLLEGPEASVFCAKVSEAVCARIEALEAQLAAARDYRQGVFETLDDYTKDNAALKASNDRLREQLAEAKARPVGVKVKPLVWSHVPVDYVETYQAECPFGYYRVFEDEDSAAGAIWVEFAANVERFNMSDAVEVDRVYGEFSDAKAAAQADYERRILSALEPAPVGVEEAARVLLNHCPNPIFDNLKPVLLGEFKVKVAHVDEDGEEAWRDHALPWDNIKDVIRAALRALSGEAEAQSNNPGGPPMTVSAETVEALHAVKTAWDHCQAVCEHRNPDRDDEGQGRICEHPDNTSGMEWCDPSHCPLLALS